MLPGNEGQFMAGGTTVLYKILGLDGGESGAF